MSHACRSCAALLLAALLLPASGARAQAAASSEPPRAVRRDLPLGPMIRRAYQAGTRDSTGMPGPRYWQQRVDYDIDARLDVDAAVLHGSERITLHNTSPDTLHRIVLRLYQNYFRAAESRNDYVTDITQGDVMERLAVNGRPVALDDPRAFSVSGTVATVPLATPIPPGDSAVIDAAWHFAVPNVPLTERGERMGRWGTSLYQIAQWYPQVAMYDDLRGWDRDQYLGKGEFYNQFGRFDVRITLPAGWLVGATGTLANADSVLAPTTRARLALALRSDTTVHVVTASERGAGSATVAGPELTWHFTAPFVNDFAWAASKDYVIDATRALTPKPTLVQVLYLPEHAAYHATAQYARFALEHHAKMVMPYEFPQATVVDGPENGMEYPMIIFCGPGLEVITHELGHQWFPMTVSSNETWYGWQDEGFNDYIDAFSNAAYDGGRMPRLDDGGEEYRMVAGTELEPPMMWPSDFAGPYYEIQAYVKAPLALYALGGVVGDSAVREAFSAYARAWRWKHPSPWDFFMFMDHRLGRDLGWFWNAWWFTTETFDQGIGPIARSPRALTVHVADHGSMAMPVIVRVYWAGGDSTTVTRPASVWFDGARGTSVIIPTRGRRAERIVVDPDNRFEDLDRSNNTWAAH